MPDDFASAPTEQPPEDVVPAGAEATQRPGLVDVSQMFPGVQSSLVPQLVPHRPSPAHLKGAQAVEMPVSLATELSPSWLQTAALPLGTHFEAAQVKPSAQSVADEQSDRQPVVVHP
jgi:hypothetical protein